MAGFAIMRIGNIPINALPDAYYIGLLVVEIILSLIVIWLLYRELKSMRVFKKKLANPYNFHLELQFVLLLFQEPVKVH